MIQLQGFEAIPAFVRDLDLAFAEMDRQMSAEFAQFTKKLFGELVRGTPQWTGDLTNAWNYSINTPDPAYSEIANKTENQQHWSKADVFQRGAEPAVSAAISKAANVHPSWRDVVYFHNPAPIAEKVENLRVMIRPINLVDGRVAMAQYMYDKYSSIGGFV